MMYQPYLPGSFDLSICTHLAMGCYKAEKVTDRLALEKALWAGALLRPPGTKHPSLLLGNCCLLDVNDGVSNIATGSHHGGARQRRHPSGVQGKTSVSGHDGGSELKVAGLRNAMVDFIQAP